MKGSVVKTAATALALALMMSAVPACAGTGRSAGATYYVSPGGRDSNPGTRELPWASPGWASKQISGGDTLVILGGRYTLSAFWDDMITPPSGTSAAWTRIVGEAGNRPVLAGRDNLFSAADISGTSYVRLENLEITSDNGAEFRGGIEAAGGPVNHVVLKDLYVHHIDEGGLNIGDTNDLLVEACNFSYCGFGCIGGPAGQQGGNRNLVVRDCYLGYSGHYYQGGSGPGPYDRPDAFGIEPSDGPIEITGTLAEHNLGDGLDSKAADTTIRECVVANNTCDGVKMWAGGRLENTLIYGMGDGVQGGSPWAGIVMSGEAGAEFEIVNVTVHDNPARVAYPVYMQYGETEPMSVLIRNTTISNGHGEVYLGDSVTVSADHNNFYRPGESVQVYANGRTYTQQDIESGQLGAANISRDPAFMNPAWGTPGDYRLSEGSPLIDAGSPAGAPATDLAGNGRPAGAGWDIGAYEYGGVPPSPRITSVSPTYGPTGAAVTLTGHAFGNKQGASSVWAGSSKVTAVLSWTGASIRIRIPPGAGGRVKLRVVTPYGWSNAKAFDVRPSINSLSPVSGPGGTTVTIAGSAFCNVQGPGLVCFGSTHVSTVVAWRQTQIKVKVPPSVPEGKVTIRVYTSGGMSNGRTFNRR